jgi:hypothetical protein
MEEEMTHGTKIKRTRFAVVIAFALVAVPVAQAKPITIQKVQSSQGETAQGLAADGLRLQALADAYMPEDRTVAVGMRREAKALSASYAKAYEQQLSHSALYATGDATAQGYQGMQAYQASLAQAGLVQHYPFANENTAAFIAAEQKANGPAPISENSPVELRLQPAPESTAPAAGHGFVWRDAGIGAGLAALLTSMLVLGAGSVLSRKRIATT